MSVLYIALPAAILLGGIGLMACLYCIRSGQYDDLDSPALRILIEEQSESEVEDAIRKNDRADGK
jgi:cbb3-type cytochrome oxidase maturation protein